ncbi:MAG: SIR2 family protein [Caldilineaceae bacterium SB0661_bin_32]|uniref:SIR2 family protein n=1 Tax=Caldilineaceae bacterium SB0661_bin_32 TaxID=2605255 RepID=A0A6B1D2B3_9CHLR|nr:SIR2 family protein [Caldilineaceae bacterium SB0661_bin_32]
MIDYSDHNHLEQLSEYLWQGPRSRASVMVGAGISRNAIPLHGEQNSFPAWRELSQLMLKELYPDTPIEEFMTKTATRIASEYSSRFGEAGLEDFLRKSIPDDSHKPGEIHRLLLKLPWNDVYTTNYDTLLERTEVAERTYSQVTKITDLMNPSPPQIIKLHGSFPCQTPFIITESHYLRYEEEFAPFVNTFRQSLIVNALVLLGFSGDDPNFQKWTRWIQHHFDNKNHPIYMISSSHLQDVERSYLIDRGVTPIDLSLVFNAAESSSESHAKRLESFLHKLLNDRPARPERWPRSVSSTSPLVNDESSALDVLHRWRSERKEYPGWIVPTDDIRRELFADLNQNYGRILKAIVEWTPVERALIFREILWRFDISMLPLESTLIM